MQKWEYLSLQPIGEKAARVNGQMLKDWKRSDIYAYINQLGELGWELVGITQIERFEWASLYFKRPKQ